MVCPTKKSFETPPPKKNGYKIWIHLEERTEPGSGPRRGRGQVAVGHGLPDTHRVQRLDDRFPYHIPQDSWQLLPRTCVLSPTTGTQGLKPDSAIRSSFNCFSNCALSFRSCGPRPILKRFEDVRSAHKLLVLLLLLLFPHRLCLCTGIFLEQVLVEPLIIADIRSTATPFRVNRMSIPRFAVGSCVFAPFIRDFRRRKRR